MYANCTAPAAGRSWLHGDTPKNFSSPWQRWQKESFARQDFKAEGSQNRVLIGIKVATCALEIAVSYTLQSSWLTLQRSQPCPEMCEKWVKHRINLGPAGIRLDSGPAPLCSGTRDDPAAVCICKITAHSRERFQTPALSTLIPSKSNPWTVQSMFDHNNLLMHKCHTPYSLFCLCSDLTFQHSTRDILIHFLLKTDQLFFPLICLTHSMCFPKQNNVFAALYALINQSVYVMHPKHWWQIYFTLPSKEKQKK